MSVSLSLRCAGQCFIIEKIEYYDYIINDGGFCGRRNKQQQQKQHLF